MNSTEWEITVHLHDFDEFWMRYGTRSSNRLMVRMEPQQLSTKLEFLEYLEQFFPLSYPIYDSYGYESYEPTLADLEASPYLLEWYRRFQSEELRKITFEEDFNGDWRSGQEVQKVVITHRLYQTSPNSTQD